MHWKLLIYYGTNTQWFQMTYLVTFPEEKRDWRCWLGVVNILCHHSGTSTQSTPGCGQGGAASDCAVWAGVSSVSKLRLSSHEKPHFSYSAFSLCFTLFWNSCFLWTIVSEHYFKRASVFFKDPVFSCLLKIAFHPPTKISAVLSYPASPPPLSLSLSKGNHSQMSLHKSRPS